MTKQIWVLWAFFGEFEDKPTHTKGISPEEGEEEEEKEVDEEVEPSEEEADGGEADGGEGESFENFKEEHKKLSDTLKGYREACENEFNYYIGLAKARLEKGVDLVTFSHTTMTFSQEVLKIVG